MTLELAALALALAIQSPATAPAKAPTPAPASSPGVGDPAPRWSLPGSDGQQHSQSALEGKHVVISFFPKAFTGG